jgi:hypothetical protein
VYARFILSVIVVALSTAWLWSLAREKAEAPDKQFIFPDDRYPGMEIAFDVIEQANLPFSLSLSIVQLPEGLRYRFIDDQPCIHYFGYFIATMIEPIPDGSISGNPSSSEIGEYSNENSPCLNAEQSLNLLEINSDGHQLESMPVQDASYQSFFYPFEAYVVWIGAEAQVSDSDADPRFPSIRTVHPDIRLLSKSASWEVAWGRPLSWTMHRDYQIRRAYIVRNLSTRILVGVVVVVTAMLVALLPMINHFPTEVQVAAALSLGLFGVRQSIRPTWLPFPSGLDIVFIVIFIALAVLTLGSFVLAYVYGTGESASVNQGYLP